MPTYTVITSNLELDKSKKKLYPLALLAVDAMKTEFPCN